MVSIPKLSALYESSLTSNLSAAGSSFSVVSGNDKEGNALSGLYGLVIDEGSADEEFVVGTISSGTVTISARGLDSDDPLTEVSGNKKAHRRGASVKITDYPILAYIRNILNAETGYTLPNSLRYASGVTPSDNSDLVDKEYADGLTYAGTSNANTTTKGIVEIATQAETEAGTATGATGATLVVSADKNGARLYFGYAADAGANDTYAITCTPAPSAYTAGMVIVFKANTVNTGACTLNVNTLGAKSLKVNKDLDPQDGYIKAGQDVLVIYDGTNFQILSVSGKPSISQTGEEIYGASSGGTDAYAITLSPAPAAYVTGQVINFKADVANTGAATLNVNALGAKTIKKWGSGGKQDLSTGDIQASQFSSVICDGTDLLLISAQQPRPIYNFGQDLRLGVTGTGTQNIAHGLGVPPRLFKVWYSANNGNNNAWNTGSGACNSTPTYSFTVNCASNDTNTSGTNTKQGTDAIIKTYNDDGSTVLSLATVSAVDATNVTLNFTTQSVNVYFQWEAFA